MATHIHKRTNCELTITHKPQLHTRPALQAALGDSLIRVTLPARATDMASTKPPGSKHVRLPTVACWLPLAQPQVEDHTGNHLWWEEGEGGSGGESDV